MRHALLLLLLSLALAGCSPRPVGSDASPRQVRDTLGRQVALPREVRRVACIGAGALRLFCYVGDPSLLCGVEACEKGFLFSYRPYQEAHKELFQRLPVIGAGGPAGTIDPEALLARRPDVILSTFYSSPGEMEKLQRDTGIPVVVLHYGDKSAFDPMVEQSLAILGEVLGEEKRAGEVVEYIRALQRELQERTEGLSPEEQPRVYLGCHSHFGLQGFGSSMAGYSLFQAVRARNVLDDAPGETGYRKLELETVLSLNPQVVFLDQGGWDLFLEEYRRTPRLFQAMEAFQTRRVHLLMPYNAYYTNLEIAYLDALLLGKILYPHRFQDVDLEERGRELFRFLLGTDQVPVPWPPQDLPLPPLP
ncbi:MAG: ABC transporter substrate-binding protein [Oligosphaeraceae bacterium]